MEQKNLVGGDQALKTSTLIRKQPIWGESHHDFLEESEGSPLADSLQDSYPDACEARNDFWSISGDFIYRHHIEPRVKFCTPREESFPILLKYRDVSRATHATFDALQESLVEDDWNIDGSRDLSDSLTFGRITSKGIYVVLGEINKKTADIEARSFMARTLGENGKECQAEGETLMVQWKTETR